MSAVQETGTSREAPEERIEVILGPSLGELFTARPILKGETPFARTLAKPSETQRRPLLERARRRFRRHP